MCFAASMKPLDGIQLQDILEISKEEAVPWNLLILIKCLTLKHKNKSGWCANWWYKKYTENYTSLHLFHLTWLWKQIPGYQLRN